MTTILYTYIWYIYNNYIDYNLIILFLLWAKCFFYKIIMGGQIYSSLAYKRHLNKWKQLSYAAILVSIDEKFQSEDICAIIDLYKVIIFYR